MTFASDKFEGKLRVIGRSSAGGNAVRSECDGAVRLATKAIGKPLYVAPQSRTTFDADESIKQQSSAVSALKKGKNDAATDEIEIQGFAILRNSNEKFSNKLVSKRSGRVCTICGTLEKVDQLAADPHVVAIRLANTVRRPVTDSQTVGTASIGERTADAEIRSDIHKFGENIGIYVGK